MDLGLITNLLSFDNALSALGGILVAGPMANYVYDKWKDATSKIEKFPDIRGVWCITVTTEADPEAQSKSIAYKEQLIIKHQRNASFRGVLISPTDDPASPTIEQSITGRFYGTETATFTAHAENDAQLELTSGVIVLAYDRRHGWGSSVYFGVTTDSKGVQTPLFAKLNFVKNGDLNGKGRTRDCDDDACKTCAVYSGSTTVQNRPSNS